mmetsp:Transcript_61787/g.132833  ORF Transcript_61787/g.132833 Transcript_61787/m.132833 type:complete len:237 (-) Transcript_61787:1972-2682(-)
MSALFLLGHRCGLGSYQVYDLGGAWGHKEGVPPEAHNVGREGRHLETSPQRGPWSRHPKLEAARAGRPRRPTEAVPEPNLRLVDAALCEAIVVAADGERMEIAKGLCNGGLRLSMYRALTEGHLAELEPRATTHSPNTRLCPTSPAVAISQWHIAAFGGGIDLLHGLLTPINVHLFLLFLLDRILCIRLAEGLAVEEIHEAVILGDCRAHFRHRPAAPRTRGGVSEKRKADAPSLV